MVAVLLVEDDPPIRAALHRALSELGHQVTAAATAWEGLRQVTAHPPGLIVLDLGLPDLDGSEALLMVRAITDAPVIIATARDDEAEIVRLLSAGADDYIVKPFGAAHLAARIDAVLRRARRNTRAAPAAPPPDVPSALLGVTNTPPTPALIVGGLEIDPSKREARLRGEPMPLTRREFDVLLFLAHRAGRVVSRAELWEGVWQQPAIGDDQTIDVHLHWLRRKLGETAARPGYLHTVRGVGVRLDAPADTDAPG